MRDSRKLKVQAFAPATAGEFIQGIYKSVPVLVSAPINLFASTTITSGTGINNLKEKGNKALNLLIELELLDKRKLKTIDIIQQSEIPVGKGMASSTADLTSLIGALNVYFNLALTESNIAKICTQVEPTDNIMFSNTNLFNHYSGEVFLWSNHSVIGKVLLIEFKRTVDTINFGYNTEFKKSEKVFSKIIDLFFHGLESQDLTKIAQAATKSAFLNQKALLIPI